MKRVITGAALAVSLLGATAAPALATNITGNNHGVIKVNSCSSIADVVNNNHGVVKIDGQGCNVEGVVISGNDHGVFKINNVCGDISKVTITNNNHGVIKVNSNGPCATGTSTTGTGSVTVSDNNHGVIKVNNGGGDVTVSGNDHGVIKVNTPTKPTTKPETPKNPETPVTPEKPVVDTPTAPAEDTTSDLTALPTTGMAFPVATVSLLGVATYLVTRLILRR